MRIVCCVCGKQVVSYQVPPSDKYRTNGPCKAGFRADRPFCFYCGKDLDENGLFPEERERL